jgi:UMF1 family MFS transporter
LFLGLDPFGSAEAFGGIGSRDSVMIPRLQVCLVLMGAWWTVFSIPALLLLRDRTRPSAEQKSIAKTTTDAFAQVAGTLRSVRNYRMLFLFLVAFLIYNDGVQTIITQASVFAQKVLHIGAGDLVMVVLMIQFVSMPGALLMGWLANKLGEKRTLMLCIGIYIVWLLAAFFITTVAQFWAMGAVLALVMGGIQSVSRAIMGQMTPASRSGEFFGFFSLSGKATSFAGPIVFGTILYLSKGQAHLAILSLLVFFIVGGALAARIDVREGRRVAEQEG